MTLFLCTGFALMVSTFAQWQTQSWTGFGRTLLSIAIYSGAGLAGYAIERLFISGGP